MAKCGIRVGITPGRLGGPRPKKFYQAQCGSKLKNFNKRSDAIKWIKKNK